MKQRDKPTTARLGKIIYVRATPEEKERIYAQAAAAHMSASRFLARCALDGRLPPTARERARLEQLLYRFQKAHLSLTQLLANTRALRLAGGDLAIEEQLREAAGALAFLLEDIRRRL